MNNAAGSEYKKAFDSRDVAERYMHSEYGDWAETGVARVMACAGASAKAMGLPEGCKFFVNVEWGVS